MQWSKSRWSESTKRRSKQSEAVPKVVLRVVQAKEAGVGVEVQVAVIPEVVLAVVEVQRDEAEAGGVQVQVEAEAGVAAEVQEVASSEVVTKRSKFLKTSLKQMRQCKSTWSVSQRS